MPAHHGHAEGGSASTPRTAAGPTPLHAVDLTPEAFAPFGQVGLRATREEAQGRAPPRPLPAGRNINLESYID